MFTELILILLFHFTILSLNASNLFTHNKILKIHSTRKNSNAPLNSIKFHS